MSVVTGVSVAIGVYGALAGLSIWFNGRIDQAPAVERRPDGLTALWVVAGVGYSLAGATLLVWAGWPVLAELAERFGALGGALGVLVVMGSAFVASGLPMLWGDMRRSYGLRTVSGAIEAARGELRGALYEANNKEERR
jgi:hypothetical protein